MGERKQWLKESNGGKNEALEGKRATRGRERKQCISPIKPAMNERKR